MSGSNSTSTPPDLTTPTPAPSPSSSPQPTPQPTPNFTPPSSSTNSSPPIAPITESPTPTPIVTPTPITTTSSIVETTTTSSELPPTTPSIPPTTTSALPTPTTPTEAPLTLTSVITQTPTDAVGQTSTLIVTSTIPPSIAPTTTAPTTTSSAASGTPGLVDGGVTKSASGGGLKGGGLIAVAVVVPIVAVALLVLAGLFLWRKRKQRKDAEELRRKEVEEYGYNPNNDPTLPAVGAVGGSAGNDGSYEMREDGSSGYRGWGTTAVASSGRKASTTMSGPSAGGGIGMAYSDTTQTPGGPISDTRSDNNLVDSRPLSTEAEALGALGPSASQNRGGDINRGPSNASSSYSAANRSDGSGEIPGYGGAGYNNQYDTGNPYTENAYGSPPGRAEMSGQPVIRDVQARRNTRIENPSHFPQQSAGISQNF